MIHRIKYHKKLILNETKVNNYFEITKVSQLVKSISSKTIIQYIYY